MNQSDWQYPAVVQPRVEKTMPWRRVAVGLIGANWLAAAHLAQAQTPPDPYNYDRQSGFVYFESGTALAGLLKIERVEIGAGRADQCVETEYGYDAYGNRTSATTRNCAGASVAATFTQRVSSSSYDSYQIAIGSQTITVPTGAFARLSTNALNHQEKSTIDPRFGALVRLESASSIPTSYLLDDWDRVTEEQRPDGTSTKTQYFVLDSCPVFQALSGLSEAVRPC